MYINLVDVLVARERLQYRVRPVAAVREFARVALPAWSGIHRGVFSDPIQMARTL